MTCSVIKILPRFFFFFCQKQEIKDIFIFALSKLTFILLQLLKAFRILKMYNFAEWKAYKTFNRNLQFNFAMIVWEINF
jgi:hypothetical protein